MIATQRPRRGNALIGIVLLLVAGALAAAAFFLLRSGESDADSGPAPVVTGTPASAEPLATESGVIAEKFEQLRTAPVKLAENGTSFSIVCLGAQGASAPLAGTEIYAAPAIPTGIDHEHGVRISSGSDGIARFEDLPYTLYDVSAAPEGYVPLRLRGAKDGKQYELVFPRGAPFTGIVTDVDDGSPVAGAYVQAQSDFGVASLMKRVQTAIRQGSDPDDIEGYEILNEPQPVFRAEATTDDKGRFEFAAIPPSAEVDIIIDHEQFDTTRDELELTDTSPVTREYKLLRRTEIFGRVVSDSDGEPIPGAKVQAGEGGIPLNAILFLGTAGASIFEDVTDANGNYRLTRIPRGKQYILVKYPGFEDYHANFEVTDVEPFQYEIRLRRAANLVGQVVDNSSNPISGAAVYHVLPAARMLGNVGLPPEPHARTAEDGTFQLNGVPLDSPFTILARHPEFVDAEQSNVIVQPGETLTGVQVMMTRGGSISGMVVDSLRQPLAGAIVTPRPSRPPGPALTPVTTAADGTFLVNHTRPGIFELQCSAPGYCEAINANVRDVATGVEFVLVREAIYSGRFLDGTDQPIEKFRVRVRASDRLGAADVRTESIRDPEGEFSVDGLAPGVWDFEFSAEGMTPLIVERVTVKEGERIENQDLRVQPGASLKGVVKSLSGKPVLSTLVRMEHLESFSATDKTFTTLQASSNTNGEFEIKNLLPGRYKVWATHPAFAPTGEREIVIEAGQQAETTFDLAKPAALRVIVRDEEGNTVPGATAWLFKGDSPADSAEKVAMGGMVGLQIPRTDPERIGVGAASDPTMGGPKVKIGDTGEITFTRKEPGDWTLWVSAKDFYKFSAKLGLEAGKESVYEVELKRVMPGLSQKEAYKASNVTNPVPGRNEVKNPTGTSGKEKVDALASLTPEERLVVRKQKDGEELSEDDLKILKEARKKLTATGVKLDKKSRKEGRAKRRAEESGEGGEAGGDAGDTGDDGGDGEGDGGGR